MKEGDSIYTLTEQQAVSCFAVQDNTTQEIIEILKDIAYMSETQEQLTINLTLLRNAAIRANSKKIFDKCLDVAKNGGIAPEDMNGCEWRFHYNADDFGNSEEPYREVFFQPTPFLEQRALDRLTVEANKCGFKGFKATYKAFKNSMRQGNSSHGLLINPTDFPQQPLELECGEWHCDSTGVSKVLKDKVEYACLHPIMPTERLVNIDTGEEKLRVSFYKGKYWRNFIASKLDLFDASKVIKYAALGVSVTSSSAKLLSAYLNDIETLNPDIIPEIESVARLGYIGDGQQFSPYVDNLVFDGDANYGNIYASITQSGNYTKWLTEAKKCRSESLTAHIMLAASFASPLIGKIGCLPFFIHLWGVESGTGKTVALMLAASVWGNPDVGQYIQTFNSTQVGHEKTAAFLNNIPMCIDELQLSKDAHGKSKFDVYQLSQGVGRTRGNKSGGIDKTPTWSLCILTTGESPLTSESSGAGAVNRVIDIECKASDSVIKDGFETSSCLKQNYGFAGRKFIESMTEDEYSKAAERYQELFKQFASGNSTEKQAMAAALIVLADELADKFIFKTGDVLTVSDLSVFLKDKADVSAGQRGYDFICDYIAMNQARFMKPEENSGEVWGKMADNKVWINASKLNKILMDNGFSKAAIMSWIDSNGLLEYNKNNSDRHKTIKTTVYGMRNHYYVIRLPEEKNDDEFVGEEFDLL